MDLETACREAFFAACNRYLTGPEHTYSTLKAAFDEFWTHNGERLARLASRCPSCSGYHAPAVTCEAAAAQHRKDDAEHMRRCRDMAKGLGWGGLLTGLPRSPARAIVLDSAKYDADVKPRWACRSASCSHKAVEADTAPCCYTCGEKMAPA